MSQSTAAAIVHTLMDAMNRGDLDAACDCYAPGAMFLAEPGRLLRTPETIREALSGMIAVHPRLRTQQETVLENGETALFHSTWTMTGEAPDGTKIEQGGQSADVLVRVDGAWRIAIDNPWGVQALATTEADAPMMP